MIEFTITGLTEYFFHLCFYYGIIEKKLVLCE